MSTTLLKIAPTEQLLFGRRSAAAALDLSPGAVDQLIASGKLRAIRIGRRVLITAESVRRLASADQVEVGIPKELAAERWP
jgi:excisionase family DNA binding protein